MTGRLGWLRFKKLTRYQKKAVSYHPPTSLTTLFVTSVLRPPFSNNGAAPQNIQVHSNPDAGSTNRLSGSQEGSGVREEMEMETGLRPLEVQQGPQDPQSQQGQIQRPRPVQLRLDHSRFRQLARMKGKCWMAWDASVFCDFGSRSGNGSTSAGFGLSLEGAFDGGRW